jgi:hypothetical protein
MRPSSTKLTARSTNKKRSTLEFADGEEASLPNPKQRPSKGESAAAKVAIAERRAAEAAAAAEKAAAAQATAKAAYAHEPEKCSHCGRKIWRALQRANHRAIQRAREQGRRPPKEGIRRARCT